jgi:crystallin alpha B
VKVVEGGWVVVDAHHPEKADEHGFISRHFVRRYKLPEGVTDEDLLIDLSVDGILQLRVPAKFLAEGDGNGKVLPINLTGRLATAAKSPLVKDQEGKHSFYGPAPKGEETTPKK